MVFIYVDEGTVEARALIPRTSRIVHPSSYGIASVVTTQSLISAALAYAYFCTYSIYSCTMLYLLFVFDLYC